MNGGKIPFANNRPFNVAASPADRGNTAATGPGVASTAQPASCKPRFNNALFAAKRARNSGSSLNLRNATNAAAAMGSGGGVLPTNAALPRTISRNNPRGPNTAPPLAPNALLNVIN